MNSAGEQPALRMLPPDERLDGADAFRRKAHLRLVVHDDLPGRERLSKLGDDGELIEVGVVVARVVDRDPVDGVLRAGEGDAPVAKQRVGVGAVLRVARDAGPNVDPEPDPGSGERRREELGDELGRLGDRRCACAGQQYRELVFAEARGRAAGEGRPEPVCDFHEQPVALVVSDRLVDLVEPVEVDEQDRAACVLELELRRDQPAKAGPVQEPGQLVVTRHVVELLDLPAESLRRAGELRQEQHAEPEQKRLENRRDDQRRPFGSRCDLAVVLVELDDAGGAGADPDGHERAENLPPLGADNSRDDLAAHRLSDQRRGWRSEPAGARDERARARVETRTERIAAEIPL